MQSSALAYKVLGPLLFLIYVNDVADLFTDGSCVKMYADDVKLYLEIENDSNVAMLCRSGGKAINHLHLVVV